MNLTSNVLLIDLPMSCAYKKAKHSIALFLPKTFYQAHS
jgi:hypothetical protein